MRVDSPLVRTRVDHGLFPSAESAPGATRLGQAVRRGCPQVRPVGRRRRAAGPGRRERTTALLRRVPFAGKPGDSARGGGGADRAGCDSCSGVILRREDVARRRANSWARRSDLADARPPRAAFSAGPRSPRRVCARLRVPRAPSPVTSSTAALRAGTPPSRPHRRIARGRRRRTPRHARSDPGSDRRPTRRERR